MKSHFKSQRNCFEFPSCRGFVSTLLFFLILFNTETISAQLTILDVNITMKPISNSLSDGVCQLTISDTTNCSFVAVELIDGVTNSLVFLREYAFDETTGLPATLSWSRNGNVINIGLGEFPLQSVWKARVRLKSASGNWGDWEQFMFN